MLSLIAAALPSSTLKMRVPSPGAEELSKALTVRPPASDVASIVIAEVIFNSPKFVRAIVAPLRLGAKLIVSPVSAFAVVIASRNEVTPSAALTVSKFVLTVMVTASIRRSSSSSKSGLRR